jgi:hypothetical protein
MGLPYNAWKSRNYPNDELQGADDMATIILGLAVTLILFLVIFLVFRSRGDHANPSHREGSYFSTYDGGHDGLGQDGGDWGGRDVSQDGGSNDGGWGDSGSGGDGGGGE